MGCAHCAALVKGDCRKVEAFKQVVKGNTLTYSIFKEYHLKKKGYASKQQSRFCGFFLELFSPCWGSLPSGFSLLCPHSPSPQSTSSF